MSDLLKLTAVEARAGLDSRAFSSVELTQAYLDAVTATRPLNQFVTETADKALEMAAASEISPASTVPATISANLPTLPTP